MELKMIRDTKKKRSTIYLITIIGLCLAMGVTQFEAQRKGGTASLEKRSLTVESWDKDYSGSGWGWRILTNKDDRADSKTKYSAKASGKRAAREVKLVSGAPRQFYNEKKGDKAKLLAVKFNFAFQGKNLVYLIPPEADHYTLEKNLKYVDEVSIVNGVKRPKCFKDARNSVDTGLPTAVECIRGVRLPGVVEKISVWVLSRNYNYDLEAIIQDTDGRSALVSFGTLNFVGWQPLTATIPKKLSQDIQSKEFGSINLILRRLQLRAKENAKLENIYLFFDELRVLTSVSRFSYEGQEITFDRADCEELNRQSKLITANAKDIEGWQLRDCKGK